MRKQYYLRPSAHGYFAWDVDRLVALSSGFKRQKIRLAEIAELDEPWRLGGNNEVPTGREIAEDVRLTEEADLSFPIIMSSNRRVMDGMHRVMKALNAKLETIDAVIFDEDPDPDYTDVYPDDLPY